MSPLFIALIISLLATLGVLIAGAATMGVGGERNRRYGNTLMIARIALQGLTLVLFLLVVAFEG